MLSNNNNNNNNNNIIQSILKARNSYNCTLLNLKMYGKKYKLKKIKYNNTKMKTIKHLTNAN